MDSENTIPFNKQLGFSYKDALFSLSQQELDMDCVDLQGLMMFRTQACLIMIFVQPQTDKYSARGVRKIAEISNVLDCSDHMLKHVLILLSLGIPFKRP